MNPRRHGPILPWILAAAFSFTVVVVVGVGAMVPR